MLNFDSSPFTNNVYKRREKNLYEYLQFVGFRNNNLRSSQRAINVEFCETIPIPWRERVSNEGKSWHVRIPSIFLSTSPLPPFRFARFVQQTFSLLFDQLPVEPSPTACNFPSLQILSVYEKSRLKFFTRLETFRRTLSFHRCDIYLFIYLFS